MEQRFLVNTAKGLEPLLRDELKNLGISDPIEGSNGVSFNGDLEQAYRVCLWSRIANRVLLQLASFPCDSAKDLYDGIQFTDWSRHMESDSSFSVRFSGTSPAIRNSHFAALTVKDAIVDQFRAHCGQRPSISIERPDIRLNVRLARQVAVLYLDLSGDSLHRRGYRNRGGKAPLKENLAAAILSKAGWNEICRRGGSFLDPMCGSGTFAIEAAQIAGDIAPGLQREYFGFLGWKGHDPNLWQSLREEGMRRRKRSLSKIPAITGYDLDFKAVEIARENVSNAGLTDFVRIEQGQINQDFSLLGKTSPGLIAVNPPYGERIAVDRGVENLYFDFGLRLKSHFVGWRTAMLVGDAELGFRVGIRSRRPLTVFNGPIECKLLIFEVDPSRFFIPKNSAPGRGDRLHEPASLIEQARCLATRSEPRAEMFVNRLRKNLRGLRKWADKAGISCYRVYDADMPEYALAVDLYRGSSQWAHVQEYQAPRSIDTLVAEKRLLDALSTIPEVLEIDPNHLYFKLRRRQKGNSQYTGENPTGKFHPIEEAGHRFLVNFESYLDTGLFLDHRITRAIIQSQAKGRRFLNLFGYTGSASVYAAGGGAISTATVDSSRTYLNWAARNFALNGLDSARHQLIRANAIEWIDQAIERGGSVDRFDLIFLDPPTFSNSKNRDDVFDVQRDHVVLIERTCRLLNPGGLLIFSTNYQKFRLDNDRLSGLNIVDISRRTLPRDFQRNPTIHRCWEIRNA